MSRRDLQNERLDRIGRKLLGAAKVSDAEIEKIIHAPNLFVSVKAKIKTEQTRRKPKRFIVDFWNWQTATGALAILIFLAIGAAAIIFRTQNEQHLTAQIESTEIQTQIKPDENPPQIPEVKKAFNNRVTVQRADFKAATPKLKKQAQKPNLVKQPQSPKQEGAFYSLALSGNWEAEAEDLRIVRAELSRAELFALGVNLPVENETPKIKTDLLVGANGVPRAIRFVE